jgi:Fe-S oxidoreductase
MSEITYEVPTMADLMARGEEPEVLFWVGCAGSFDDRYKRVTVAFVKILNKLGIKFAVLGTEEAAPATRRGGPATTSCSRCRPSTTSRCSTATT